MKEGADYGDTVREWATKVAKANIRGESNEQEFVENDDVVDATESEALTDTEQPQPLATTQNEKSFQSTTAIDDENHNPNHKMATGN